MPDQNDKPRLFTRRNFILTSAGLGAFVAGVTHKDKTPPQSQLPDDPLPDSAPEPQQTFGNRVATGALVGGVGAGVVAHFASRDRDAEAERMAREDREGREWQERRRIEKENHDRHRDGP